MLPLLMRFKIRQPGRRGFGLWFPVVFIWVLLAALMLVLLPFVLVGALVSAGRGPGLRLLVIYPLLASVVWHLGGLKIDIEAAESAFLIDFI